MTTLHVLRVFLGPDGGGGNPLGVVLDGPAVPEGERQAIAAELGFSETVFVDPAGVRIFTPAVELPFAGHPLVGTAWLLARTGTPPSVLHPPAGEVPTWTEGELTWIAGRPEWVTPFELEQLPAPADVDAFAGPGRDAMVAVWAWEEEAAGRLRVRVFPTGIGIEEDEATGACAVQFGATLRRDLVIRQGVGSELRVHPRADGSVAVGGRVALESERPLP